MSSKLLIIGLDSMTFDLLKPWMEEGDCPNLEKIMDEGVHGNLKSVPNLNSVPAWISFMTGKNPGKHGIYWFYERKDDSYDFRFCSGGDVKERHFWEYAPGKAGIVNIPMTYPARETDGFMISGLDAPSEDSEGFTHPPELYGELKRAIGEYHIDTNILGYARGGRLDRAVEATYEVIEARLKACRYLIENKEWDLFCVVFTALDRIQHTFWRFMDKQHPFYDEKESIKYRHVIKEFYVNLDGVVGELLDLVPGGTSVVALSDHGAGFNQMGNTFLQPFLESLGLFQKRKDLPFKKLFKVLLKSAYLIADKTLSKRMRKNIMELVPGGRALLVTGLHRINADWEQTKAYSAYIRPEIWLNVEGREPMGTVKKEEYEELREYIMDKLRQCRDIETGMPVVDKVYKREEIYNGKHLSEAPDILVEWNYEGVVTGLTYPGDDGNPVYVRSPSDVLERRNVSGDHRPHGIFMAKGGSVKKGATVEDAHIMDVAPTVLHMLKCGVPDDMDGKVLEGVFTDDFMKENPVKKVKPGESSKDTDADYTDEESKKIEERLKGLGYME